MAEAGIGSREGKGPAVREGPAERHSMSLPVCPHLLQFSHKSVPGDTFLPSTWHDVHADVLAAGCNLNGEAPSFRPKPGRRKQGGEQAV